MFLAALSVTITSPLEDPVTKNLVSKHFYI